MLRPRFLARALLLVLLTGAPYSISISPPGSPLLHTLAEARKSGGSVYVRGYYRSNGTYVRPHYRSAPDGNFWNNWGTKGNVNPYTGELGTKTNPPARYYGGLWTDRPPRTTTYPEWADERQRAALAAWETWANAGGAPASVLELQRALVAAGEDPGPQDGVLGPRTLRAIVSFNSRLNTTARPPTTVAPDNAAPSAAFVVNQSSTSHGLDEFFTVGSTKDRVLAIQGQPRTFFDSEWWYGDYGGPKVYFEQGRVTRWDPNDGTLKARLVSSAGATRAEYFTVGSTKDEVLAIQGQPRTFFGSEWWYGDYAGPKVYFEQGRVKRWDPNDGTLKARLDYRPGAPD